MPSDKFRVSVALASYNGEQHLDRQLKSIADQTICPFELVLCDDQSTDQTLEIAEEFAVVAPFPVRIFRNEQNLGFIGNFRNAAAKCSGDLIAFCDQDDWWQPNRLELCIEHFRDEAVQLYYHNAWVVDGSGARTGLLYDPGFEGAAVEQARPFPFHAAYGLTQVFRSDLRRFDDLWDQSQNHIREDLDILAHDQWYFFLAQMLGKIAFEDLPLVEYQQHGANLVGASWMRPTLRRRLLGKIDHRGRDDERRAAAARSRAAIARQVQKRELRSADRIQLFVDAYQTMAGRLDRRAATYSAEQIKDRFDHLILSWRSGDYSGWPWGFDRRSVVRDLVMGVLFAKY